MCIAEVCSDGFLFLFFESFFPNFHAVWAVSRLVPHQMPLRKIPHMLYIPCPKEILYESSAHLFVGQLEASGIHRKPSPNPPNCAPSLHPSFCLSWRRAHSYAACILCLFSVAIRHLGSSSHASKPSRIWTGHMKDWGGPCEHWHHHGCWGYRRTLCQRQSQFCWCHVFLVEGQHSLQERQLSHCLLCPCRSLRLTLITHLPRCPCLRQ